MKKGLISLTIALALAASAFSQETDVGSWFKEDPRANTYRDAEAHIRVIFDDARAAGLPLWVLMDKLREGASKGVPPERLTAGLASEAARLGTAKGILEKLNVVIPDRREYEETLKDASIALLAGIQAGTIEAFFTHVRTAGRTSRDVRAACTALIQMKSVSRLTETDLKQLGEALLSSALPASAFTSIPSFFVKARVSGLRETDILYSIVVKALQTGGGLARMEELMRLRQKGG